MRRLASGRPEGELLEGLFGYVRVPVVDPNQWETYAQELAGSITELREAGTCGWVVDLRDFRFSDPARDLLGIGALLGDGLVATIESAAGQVEWRYEEGQVLVGGVPLRQLYEAADFDTAGLEIDAGPIEAGPQAIALLVSVESAASFSALWLAAQDGTRIFGELPSVGHSMINAVGLTAVLVLPDGAQASVVSARIDGDDRLQPAEVVLSIPDSGTDEVLQAALKWLRGKPCLQ